MMDLESTVMTINNLLQFKFDEKFQSFLQSKKCLLAIPDYQREYKWDESKVKTFARDIFSRNKFLGIITSEVSDGEYLSIVDGQQRLTAIMLILTALYNACADEGETETQKEIENIISCQIDGKKHFRLKNESVGEYLCFVDETDGKRKIKLQIDPMQDIYKQVGKFEDSYKYITNTLAEVREKNSTVTLDDYKQHLIDCKILLFAQKNPENLQQGSSEEIYIDINEKLQQLDPEDIFKGHCFAICKTPTQQENVKRLWRNIKQQYFNMNQIFKKASMDSVLHYYLLTEEATKATRVDITKKLTVKGSSIITLYHNTPTQVIRLLQSIECYQRNIYLFVNELKILDNNFYLIARITPQEIGNHQDDLRVINSMLTNIIYCDQNLFKLPLFYLIHTYYQKPQDEKMSYQNFSNFMYLYYVYMFLFSKMGGTKKREKLANGLIKKIHDDGEYVLQFIREICNYSDGLNPLNKINVLHARKQLYCILDYFKVESPIQPITQDSQLTIKLKLFPENYNLEHLIINQSHTITWKSKNESIYEFSNEDFSTCPAWLADNNNWANFIWTEETFNRAELKNKDIIAKLIELRGHFLPTTPPDKGTYAKKHVHIELICQHIMNTQGFDQLIIAYNYNESRVTVLEKYRAFINNYFSEESINSLSATVENKFNTIIANLRNLV